MRLRCRYCRKKPVDPVRPWPRRDEDGALLSPGPVACRACFAIADASDEAAEMMFPWRAVDVEVPPTLRLVRPMDDLTGRRFGRLTVLRKAVVRRSGFTRSEWLCRCDCGDTLTVSTYRLTKLGVSSCWPCGRRAQGRARHFAVKAAKLAREAA